MKEEFINLLKSTKREGIDQLINWLENETDFFIAPASSKYHLCKENGLLEHSLNVFRQLIEETSGMGFDPRTIIIISLLHDLCKVNNYKIDYKNQKNKDGIWEQVQYYKADDIFPIGHGDKSIILAQKFIDLTDEEILAIRWHMGGFESKENYSSVSKVFNKSKLALLLHTADLKATYILENQ